jgi:hypothetical protein
LWAVVAGGAGAALRLEGRLDGDDASTEAAQHVFKHAVAADAQPIPDGLHFGMAVTEMPGEAGKRRGVGRRDLGERLRSRDDSYSCAVAEHQAIAVAQRRRLGKIEEKLQAALGGQRDAAAEALVGIEHHAVNCIRRAPAQFLSQEWRDVASSCSLGDRLPTLARGPSSRLPRSWGHPHRAGEQR